MRYILLIVLFFLNTSCFAKTEDNGFKRGQIKIGSKTITIEIADTPDLSAKGLMFRKSMPEDQGMLFVFVDEDIRAFWMKNTLIPLSIAYIDKDRKIVDIQDMAPAANHPNPPSYPSKKPAKYALEMNQGWFKKNKITIGDQFNWVNTQAK